jgi:hypothetical protein
MPRDIARVRREPQGRGRRRRNAWFDGVTREQVDAVLQHAELSLVESLIRPA